MPDPTTTGYVVVSIAVGDDDTPEVDPQKIAEAIVDARIPGVVSARTVFSTGDGRYAPYGTEVVAF